MAKKKEEGEKENLVTEALQNIRSDRNQAQFLLTKLLEYILENKERHLTSGMTAAKYLETLQRSNEQLVKIVQFSKKPDREENLSEDDKEELLDMLDEREED